MRIVHVAPFYHPITGGVEEVITRLAEHMAGRGEDVHVVTYNRLRRGGYCSLPKSEVINGVSVVRLRPNIALSYGTYSHELPEVLRNLKPDIVHVHVWRHPHVLQVAKLRRRSGFRAILHGHAPFHRLAQLGLHVWLYHRFIDAFKRDVLSAYDRVVALTPHEKSMFANMLGQDGGRITIAPNGVDDGIFAHGSDVQDGGGLLYVGRLCREKNLGLLVKALRFVVSEIPGTRLVLAGQDEGSAAGIMSSARDMGLENDIVYVGRVEGERKNRLYVSSKLFVSPCLYEAFGMSLVEAQAFGKPCVITGFGGQVYAAPPGLTSVLTEPSPEEYARGILTLINDDGLYLRLSRNARAWAHKFAWSRVLRTYEKLYEDLR